jgi:hypothetical protein
LFSLPAGPPSRIDLLSSLAGVEFEICYPLRAQVAIDEVTVSFLDLANLRRNKRAAGRLHDLADLEHLE